MKLRLPVTSSSRAKALDKTPSRNRISNRTEQKDKKAKHVRAQRITKVLGRRVKNIAWWVFPAPFGESKNTHQGLTVHSKSEGGKGVLPNPCRTHFDMPRPNQRPEKSHVTMLSSPFLRLIQDFLTSGGYISWYFAASIIATVPTSCTPVPLSLWVLWSAETKILSCSPEVYWTWQEIVPNIVLWVGKQDAASLEQVCDAANMNMVTCECLRWREQSPPMDLVYLDKPIIDWKSASQQGTALSQIRCRWTSRTAIRTSSCRSTYFRSTLSRSPHLQNHLFCGKNSNETKKRNPCLWMVKNSEQFIWIFSTFCILWKQKFGLSLSRSISFSCTWTRVDS